MARVFSFIGGRMQSNWFVINTKREYAKIRLFCFPYAGGSAQVFHGWERHLPEDIEVVCIQYPGRANRLHDPLIDDCAGMVESLVNEIQPLLDKPFAFLGYSMGALVSFELANALRERGNFHQIFHFLCAFKAAHLCKADLERYRLSDDDLKQELLKLGGLNAQLLRDDDFMSFILPIIRSDFHLVDKYDGKFAGKLRSNALVIYGSDDHSMTPEDALQWESLISGQVRFREIKGSHFFINTHTHELLSIVGQELRALASAYL
ncbi:thioesterase [Microbulbifer harenosus]|uniref:Thioesterase n=2 Tax=Microbulbifer harenosus TaxID=2576840 RepID=A0ABY2UEJ4_9GAMM|nr:thioesterase [Microbulbifer harenosus]